MNRTYGITPLLALLIAITATSSLRAGYPPQPAREDEILQMIAGLQNARRLLPIAREVMIAALTERSDEVGVSGANYDEAIKAIRGIDTIIMDPQLGGSAEVDPVHPHQIRIGPDYAFYLVQDDEVMFLLGHELTHVAAWNGSLAAFIDSVNARTIRLVGVVPAPDQREDVAADFIGEQTLRSFVTRHPTTLPDGVRISRVLGYDNPESYDGEGDETHLPLADMLRTWKALDPELQGLVASR